MATVLLFILGVVIFIVGLVLSVALHELGHLTFAKIFGVKVSQYMVGFGRTVWSIKRGDTEYGFKPILLGGYISMAGMFPPARVKVADGDHDPVPEATLRRNIFSALVQDAREASATTIGASDPARAFYNAAPWKRIIIMFAGPFMNLLIAVGIVAILACGFGLPQPDIAQVSACVPATATAHCAPSDAASPAKTAGLRSGDVFVAVNGKAGLSTGQITAILQRSAGESVDLTVSRDGTRRSITVVPTRALRTELDSAGDVVTDAQGKTVTKQLGTIGVAIGGKLVPQPASQILPTVGLETSETVGLLWTLPSGLAGVWNSTFSSSPRSLDGPISIVGVGRAIGTEASMTGVPIEDKFYTILGLLGSLNIALFVLNLLPLLPLDGGHIVGAVWEWVRRGFARVFHRRDPGPVDLAKAMPMSIVVVTVLGAMSLFLVFADLVNPINLNG